MIREIKMPYRLKSAFAIALKRRRIGQARNQYRLRSRRSVPESRERGVMNFGKKKRGLGIFLNGLRYFVSFFGAEVGTLGHHYGVGSFGAPSTLAQPPRGEKIIFNKQLSVIC